MKIEECISSVGKGWSRIHKDREYDYDEGEVITPHGIVSVYAQGGDKFIHITRLDFIKDGKIYVRTFRGKRYSHRGMVTKAKQFAEEIFNKST